VGENTDTRNAFEGPQMLDLADKDVKATIINILNDLMKIMFKELRIQVWWCMPIIPALRRLRQEDFQFKDRSRFELEEELVS
jgi:hypothetical protein